LTAPLPDAVDQLLHIHDQRNRLEAARRQLCDPRAHESRADSGLLQMIDMALSRRFWKLAAEIYRARDA